MTSVAVNSGWFGYGEPGTFTFGEEYIPVSITETDTVSIYEVNLNTISTATSEDFSITETKKSTLCISITRVFAITDVYFYPTIIASPSDSLSITDSKATQIAISVTDNLVADEEFGTVVLEQITIDEEVVCTLVLAITDDMFTFDADSTLISVDISEDIDTIESLAFSYSLSVDEILSVIETISATAPHQYKKIQLHCELETPPVYTLYCTIDTPPILQLKCRISE